MDKIYKILWTLGLAKNPISYKTLYNLTIAQLEEAISLNVQLEETLAQYNESTTTTASDETAVKKTNSRRNKTPFDVTTEQA
jgi:hypothetical protein